MKIKQKVILNISEFRKLKPLIFYIFFMKYFNMI